MHTYIYICTLAHTWKKAQNSSKFINEVWEVESSSLITWLFAMHVYSKKAFFNLLRSQSKSNRSLTRKHRLLHGSELHRSCRNAQSKLETHISCSVHIPSWKSNSVTWFVALQRQTSIFFFLFCFPSRGFSWDQKAARLTPSFRAFWKFIVQVCNFPPKFATHQNL